jgi:predicted transcriptional regulator
MLRTPADESKMIDEHLTYLSEILAKRMQKRCTFDNEVMRVMDTKKRKEFDKSKMERQIRKFFSSKRYAREQLLELERDLRRVGEEEAIAIENLDKVDATIKLYEKLAKRFELISEYRKRLNKIVDAHHEYNAKIAEIAAPKRYFEKCADLTEREQLKIIFKILTDQEDTLTHEVIYKDILDLEHFKDYIKSVVRAFKTPTIMGYKSTYKTDYIWVTVTTPPKMWTEDMSQEIYTALAGYVTSEVSRTITVRVVESRDPWITRVLVVGGRGKAEDMEAFDEMQNLYSKSNDFERYLSRSFLIEHGIHASNVIKQINLNNGYLPANNGNNLKK